MLGNIKADGLKTLSKYPIKYLELVFVSINFEITILSTSSSKIFIVFLYYKTFLTRFQRYCVIKKNCHDFLAMDSICCPHKKTDLATITILQSFSILSRGKLSSELRLIFIHFSS